MYKFPAFATVESADARFSMFGYMDIGLVRHYPVTSVYIPTGYEKLDRIIKNLGVPVVYDVPQFGEDSPYTDTTNGSIHSPHPDAFASPKHYAHTIAHELGHLSGRYLKRPGSGSVPIWDVYMTNVYDREELVAELASMGLEQELMGDVLLMEESIKYLRSWTSKELKSFESHEAMYDDAQEDAARAVNFLLELAK